MHKPVLPTLDQVLAAAAPTPATHLGRVVLSEAQRAHAMPSSPLEARPLEHTFERALLNAKQQRGGAIIAEYKRASPSLGAFAADRDFREQLLAYRNGGAACVSILAEPNLFQGSTADVVAAAEFGMPRVYKGFVLGEAHLKEAQASGAQAVLLIARVLKAYTAVFADAARRAGLEPLVELHDLSEIDYARQAKARLVGINARDLASFSISSPDASPLRAAFPDAVLIRESGLRDPEDIQAAFAQGFDAVLIGEALMRSEDPQRFLEAVYA